MTAYYILCGDKNHGTLANMRSSDTEFIDDLESGKTFQMKRIPRDEQTTDDQRLLIEITEFVPVKIVGPHIQAGAEDLYDQALDYMKNNIPPREVEKIKNLNIFYHDNETIDTRELAIRIAKEKSAHASVVSKAYDTGEATSMAAYTDEIEDVICRTLEAIKPVEKTLFEEFPEVLEEYKKAATERMNQMPSSFDDVVIPTRTFNHADFKCVVCGSTRKLSFPGEPARVQYCPTCELNTMYQLDDAVWGKKRGLEALVTTDRETDLIRSVQDLLERRIRSGTSTLELKEIQKLLEDSE